jgi:hypothetical protein
MTSYRNRHLDGYHDADEKVRDQAADNEAKRIKVEQKTGNKTKTTTSSDVSGLTK